MVPCGEASNCRPVGALALWKWGVSPAGDDREQLILDHLHLVQKIARQVMRLFTHHIDFEDLVQCGRLGLVKAAARYHPDHGPFEHYAYFFVRGHMIDPHRRAAFREAQHDSVEHMQERLGFVPARVATCRQPLPDDLAERRQRVRVLAAAIAELPEDERFVLVESLHGEPLLATAAARGRSLTWARVKLSSARQTVAAVVQGKAA